MAKILIIDDEINMRAIFVNLLGADYTIYEANNGKEGLHLFTLHHPDLIITDLNMPYISGLDLIHNLRASRTRAVIIVCSAYMDNSAEVLKAGADVCFTKPVELAALKKTVDSFLAGQP